MQYAPDVRIIRTMCSGRVSQKFIRRAFADGAAVVLVSGCHIGDCHYINANHQTKRRVEKMWAELERKGINKERLQLDWFTAAEGQKFAVRINEMREIVGRVTPEDIKKSIAAFKEN